jgi:hypothetical protein
VNVRPGTLGLAGYPPQPFEAPHWGEKALLDIESIQPGSLGQPARLSHIFVLNGAGEPDSRHVQPADPDLEVLVTRLDEGLLDGLRDLELVDGFQTASDRGYPCLQVRTTRRMETLSRIEALCREHHVRVLDVTKRSTRQPSFEGPARLEPLSTSETVLELLRRFQGGHQATLLQEEFQGSAAHLYRELAAGITGAECYRLTSGPLDRMADLVAELVEAT